MKRQLSEPEKKTVAARQQWRCSACAVVLPPTYQVDHTVPLWAGGEDTVDNCTAMCPNCHAAKTQQEAIARAAARRETAASAEEMYDNRTDIYDGNTVTCALCGKRRPQGVAEHVCPVIEFGGRAPAALDRFRFTPRQGGGGRI